MTLPNAGGHSERSEALSFEVLHRLLGAELLKAEMEIKYVNSNWKKTDYLVSIQGKKIAVSVTRSVGFPRASRFNEADAEELLTKKLVGICASTMGVTDEDRWERQILHIFAPAPNVALVIHKTYQTLHPKLRANTIVIITVAGMHEWIFS